MRIKKGFILREIAGTWVVVPVGERVVEFNGLVSLNESGAVLWKRLEEEVEDDQEMIELLTNTYDIDECTARNDVTKFLQMIKEKEFMEL